MQRKASEDILRKLQAMPESWQRVDAILETSKSQQAKFFALQVHLLASGLCFCGWTWS